MFYIDENGNGRGYRIDDCGMLHITTVAMIDGKPVDNHGEPLQFTGEVEQLQGWPDPAALHVSDDFMIGLLYPPVRAEADAHTSQKSSFHGTISAECPNCSQLDGFTSSGEHPTHGQDRVRCSGCGKAFLIQW